MGRRRKGSSQTEAIPDELRCKRSDGKTWRCSARSLEGKGMCEKHMVQAKKRQAVAALRQPPSKRRKREGKANINLLKKGGEGELPRKDKKLVSCDNEPETQDDIEPGSDVPLDSPSLKHSEDVKRVSLLTENANDALEVRKKAVKREIARNDKESVSDEDNEIESDALPDIPTSQCGKESRSSSFLEKHPANASKIVEKTIKGKLSRRRKQEAHTDKDSESDNDSKVDFDSPSSKQSKDLKPLTLSTKQEHKRTAKRGILKKHEETDSSDSESDFEEDNGPDPRSTCDALPSNDLPLPIEHSKEASKLLKKATRGKVKNKGKRVVSSENEYESYDSSEPDSDSSPDSPPSNPFSEHNKASKTLPQSRKHLKDTSKRDKKVAYGGFLRKETRSSGDNEFESNTSDSQPNSPHLKRDKDVNSLQSLPGKHPEAASTGQGNHTRYRRINKSAARLKRSADMEPVERLERVCDDEDLSKKNKKVDTYGIGSKITVDADGLEGREKDTSECVSKLKSNADGLEGKCGENIENMNGKIKGDAECQKKYKEKMGDFERKRRESTESFEKKDRANIDDQYEKKIKGKVDDFERKVRFKDEPGGKGSKRKMKPNDEQLLGRSAKRKHQDDRKMKENEKRGNIHSEKHETEEEVRDKSRDLLENKNDDLRTRSRPKTDESVSNIEGIFGGSTRNVKAFASDESNPMERHRPSDVQKISALRYMLSFLLPVLKSLDKKQNEEIEIEAELQGISAIDIERTRMKPNESLFCDDCNLPIVDLYRSCSNCNYDLCLACCQKIRECRLLDSKHTSPVDPTLLKSNDLPMLKVNEDGSIPCPLRCGCQKIVLTQLAKRGWISNLIKDVEAALDNKMLSQSLSSGPYELCAAENIRPSAHTKCQRQAAQRSNSSDNFIYSPSALDMGQQALESFQKHWLRGEPVIVQDVLEKEKEPRWHPLTMWRDMQENNDIETVKAIDYLDCNQVEINICQFLEGYQDGRMRKNGWPEMLGLKDWPPANFFFARLQSYATEFINALPFHDYTHPTRGMLNLVTKIPKHFPKPTLGPKTHIAYGVKEELGQGDSVTKLHCNLLDTVNVLTHCTDPRLSDWHCERIREAGQKNEYGNSDQTIGKGADATDSSVKDKKFNEIQKASMMNCGTDSSIHSQDGGVESFSVSKGTDENIDNVCIKVEDARTIVPRNDDTEMFRGTMPDGTAIGANTTENKENEIFDSVPVVGYTTKQDHEILNTVTVEGHASKPHFDQGADIHEALHPETSDKIVNNEGENPKEQENSDASVIVDHRLEITSIENIDQRECEAKVMHEDAVIEQKCEDDHVLIEQRGEKHNLVSDSKMDIRCGENDNDEGQETQTMSKVCNYEEVISHVIFAEKVDVTNSDSHMPEIDIIVSQTKEKNSVEAKGEIDQMNDVLKPQGIEDGHHSVCQETNAVPGKYQDNKGNKCLDSTEKARLKVTDTQIVPVDVQNPCLLNEGKSIGTVISEKSHQNFSEIVPELDAENEDMSDCGVKPQETKDNCHDDCNEVKIMSKENQKQESDIINSDLQMTQVDVQNGQPLSEEKSKKTEVKEDPHGKNIVAESNALEEPITFETDLEDPDYQSINAGVEGQEKQANSKEFQRVQESSNAVLGENEDRVVLDSKMSQIDMQGPHLSYKRESKQIGIKEEDNLVPQGNNAPEANKLEESVPIKVDHSNTDTQSVKLEGVEDNRHSNYHETQATSKGCPDEEASDQVKTSVIMDSQMFLFDLQNTHLLCKRNTNGTDGGKQIGSFVLEQNTIQEGARVEPVQVKVEHENEHIMFEGKDQCMKTVEVSHHMGSDLQGDFLADNRMESANGGALWDIFRREDIPKLQAYLKQHWTEFKSTQEESLIHAGDSIHDRTIFLNEEHKRKLKEEYGIEAWTFHQHWGEAVLIPAGCPHQVRNKKSCVKVALDFVTPESISECIRMTEEFRLLPKGHHVKENMLEVMKIVIFSAVAAVKQLNSLLQICQKPPRETPDVKQ